MIKKRTTREKKVFIRSRREQGGQERRRTHKVPSPRKSGGTTRVFLKNPRKRVKEGEGGGSHLIDFSIVVVFQDCLQISKFWFRIRLNDTCSSFQSARFIFRLARIADFGKTFHEEFVSR